MTVNFIPRYGINAGNWELSEATLRAFVADEGINVEVITGTIGVLRLPDCRGNYVDIYLDVGGHDVAVNPGCYKPHNAQPEKQIRAIPVPLFFYKLVINRAAKSGVALLSINNPYVDELTFTKEVEKICVDVLDSLNWVNFIQTAKRGFMAACKVKDFVATVPHLPANIDEGINDLLNGVNPKIRNRRKS